ncbi:hypothetical protein QTG54_012193 [Skeletonema marinoi]|uniref:Uncharacterized protein n=1 Tax=Skeletonema marinoi TaxID=267567 RepID=A0AAD8Y1V6_9STRA|nr:hypothetical protein QTG54_012193 [Skeletonema marinoi]
MAITKSLRWVPMRSISVAKTNTEGDKNLSDKAASNMEKESRHTAEDIDTTIIAVREKEEETVSMHSIFGNLFHCWGAYEMRETTGAYAPAQLEIETRLKESRKQALEQIEAKLRKQEEEERAQRLIEKFKMNMKLLEAKKAAEAKNQAEHEASQAIEIDISKDLMKTLQAKEKALRALEAKKAAEAKKQAAAEAKKAAKAEKLAQKDVKEASESKKHATAETKEATEDEKLAQKDAKEG